MVLLQLKESLELFLKRREFLSGSGFPGVVEGCLWPFCRN